jgi:hypothetical protein
MHHEEVRARVIEKSPVLGEIISKHGSKTLFNYFSETLAPAPDSVERKGPMLSVLSGMAGDLIGPGVVENIQKEMQSNYSVSTADHHGPLTHPFFVGSNVARSITLRESDMKNVVVLACGGISLSNSSFPRGLLFHNEEGESQRVLFAPWRDRLHPVYGYRAYSNISIEKLSQEIQALYNSPRVYQFKTFSEQITHTNYHLWKKMPGLEEMNLIYLQQEDVVNKLLVEHHIPRKTILYKLLTDEKYLSSFQREFNGVKGAFSGDGKGTFLFWALVHGRREALRLEGDVLVNSDRSYILRMTPKTIIEAINKHELFPSMALMFIVCAFYHGLTCLGGFSQVTYLGQMKKAYLALLEEMGESKEKVFAERISTNLLGGDLLYIYISGRENHYPATSLDIISSRNPNVDTVLFELVRQCTVREALDQMMPDLHKIFFGVRTNPPAFLHPML